MHNLISSRATFPTILTTVLVVSLFGCASPTHRQPDGRHHSDLIDAVFKRRHYDPRANAECDPAMALARELTDIEDDLRRDGTITVKKPDVWGDGNLMHYLQEYDGILKTTTQTFKETLQAYVFRSDALEVESTAGLSSALSGDATPVAATTINLTQADGLFEALTKASGVAKPPAGGQIGVEPTELARQQSTFVDVCQALRRRHLGDDNSRAAGYGLYKFRIPVSVLPGRETASGHAAVVTLRAQVEVDDAHLKYTFPRLAIADLVDTLTPVFRDEWEQTPEQRAAANGVRQFAIDSLSRVLTADFANAEDIKVDLQKTLATAQAADRPAAGPAQYGALRKSVQSLQQKLSEKKFSASRETKQLDEKLAPLAIALNTTPKKTVADRSQIPGGSPSLPPGTDKIYTEDTLKETFARLERIVQIEFQEKVPAPQEIRAALFQYFGQVHNVLYERRAYCDPHTSDLIARMTRDVTAGNFSTLEMHRQEWLDNPLFADLDSQIKSSSWLLALHFGLLDHNLKRLLIRSAESGRLSERDAAILHDPHAVRFYCVDGPCPEALALWRALIREEFPLHVFTLDAQVEEQNVYDAFSRRRELQLALAYNVARGRFNMQQKLAMSRQLALDEAAIGLNRTVVGFAHGNDTFGWYFHPRVQPPPTESSNIAAFARTLWSTGPTQHYDLKHRKLEPGIRECEVLVAMPSFVNNVHFDVTTNWESLACPGVTKRSYEEMLAQGGRIHQLKTSLGGVCPTNGYRPGDIERLFSRVDQLENMLGMQSYGVKVPFYFEQSGTDLFDRGRNRLVPEITGFYGLEYIQPSDTADAVASFFLTGKNFHPTLTHVITGGFESHTTDSPPSVEVISRELISVKVTRVNGKLSDLKRGFQVRVGTPDGLSGPVRIKNAEPPPKEEKPKGFAFSDVPQLIAARVRCAEGNPSYEISAGDVEQLEIRNNEGLPLKTLAGGTFVAEITGKTADGKDVTFTNRKGGKKILLDPIPVNFDVDGVGYLSLKALSEALNTALRNNRPDADGQLVLSLAGYLGLEQWPLQPLLQPLPITVTPCVGNKSAAVEALPPLEKKTETEDPAAPAAPAAEPPLKDQPEGETQEQLRLRILGPESRSERSGGGTIKTRLVRTGSGPRE